MNKNLLLIFTRNPEWGQCKTRLAADIGNDAALAIYKELITHTVNVTKNLSVTKQVYYSNEIIEIDSWDVSVFQKKKQKGSDLGARMQHAFQEGFQAGFKNIVIIGSDLYDITSKDITNAFEALENNSFVIGPAQDGGYYLLGMKKLHSKIFINKPWGSATVLEETLKDIGSEKYLLLPERNDVDYFEDLKNIPEFLSIIETYGNTKKH